jgi:transposase-like protein
MEWDAAGREFLSRFQTEEACVDYLVQLKWPHGFNCERCGCRNVYRTGTRRLPLFECAECRYQASPIVGTVMEGSSTPLLKWFLALYLISQEKLKTNATELSRMIQVTYKTGWLILHKIRHAMGEADADIPLFGDVTVNSAIYGKRPFTYSFDRLPYESPVLIGASMNKQQETVYVKIKLVPDEHLKEKTIYRSGLEAFTEMNIEAGATTECYIKEITPLKQRPTLPIFKASRKWIQTTFRGLGPRHLQAYLDEFCYRLNLKLRNSTSIFEELVRHCTSTKPITYIKLTS